MRKPDFDYYHDKPAMTPKAVWVGCGLALLSAVLFVAIYGFINP